MFIFIHNLFIENTIGLLYFLMNFYHFNVYCLYARGVELTTFLYTDL